MNKVEMIGRLTKDPELRTNEAGTSKCNFNIAINRLGVKEGMQDVDFIPCTAWNKQAENLAKYQGKGCLIGIEGEIRRDTYTDKDGESKSYMYVLANRIEFLSSSGVDHKEESPTEEATEEDINNLIFTDEDLPF